MTLPEKSETGKPRQETAGPFACPRFSKLFMGCEFEARYDIGPVAWPDNVTMKGFPTSALEAFRAKTYIHDICIRCGRTVER